MKQADRNPRRLTLLVPALELPLDAALRPGDGEPGGSPLLQTMLSRAGAEATEKGLEAQLFQLFGVEKAAGNDLPVAAVTYPYDGGNRPGWHLRCDPVHLVPGHNSLLLAGSEDLDISPEESAAFIEELGRLYGDRGWHFEALHPHRWYLTLPEPPSLQTHPLPTVQGHSIEHHLPLGEDAPRWHTLLAEIQMVLHASPLNRRRESSGKPIVNSLWFWGGGPPPRCGAVSWSRVWSDEPLGGGFAEMVGVPHSPMPRSAMQWLRQAGAGAHLLVLDEARYIPRFGPLEQWLRYLGQLETTWFSPLLAALKQGELEELELFAGSGHRFRITRRSLRRWWRRRRPLEVLLRDGR